jgi:hypothetical protein
MNTRTLTILKGTLMSSSWKMALSEKQMICAADLLMPARRQGK